jgi:hypothetical protein
LGLLDDLSDGGFVAHHQLVNDIVGFAGHVGSVGGTPDTGLTRGVGRTL